MTLEQFIRNLQNIKDELKQSDVVVIAENGLELTPKIKFKLKDKHKISELSKENVESIVITW